MEGLKGRVTAVMGHDWALMEFGDSITGRAYIKLQDDPPGKLDFTIGGEVLLMTKEEYTKNMEWDDCGVADLKVAVDTPDTTGG